MSYTENISDALLNTLSKTAGLPTFQLAGHVPNLEFWMKEVCHARLVIGGYEERYTKLIAAQSSYDAANPAGVKSRAAQEYDHHPPRLALSVAKADKLQRKLSAAAEKIIERCLKEELIGIEKADELREVLQAHESA
jgi:hypothetical protein